jgi:hypothetical protein
MVKRESRLRNCVVRRVRWFGGACTVESVYTGALRTTIVNTEES